MSHDLYHPVDEPQPGLIRFAAVDHDIEPDGWETWLPAAWEHPGFTKLIAQFSRLPQILRTTTGAELPAGAVEVVPAPGTGVARVCYDAPPGVDYWVAEERLS